MPSYMNWGTALVAVWVATFFVNWALHGGDPFGLIFLEGAATAIFLVAWAGWTLFTKARRPHQAHAALPGNPPLHLWLIAFFVGLWFAFSAVNQFVMPPAVAAGGAPLDLPLWVDVTWACALLAGALGALLLALRSRHAVLAFAASLAAFAVGATYQAGVALRPNPGLADLLLFASMSLLIPAALLVYAWRMRARGFLR